MNYEVLDKLLDKQDVDVKKIWKFFGASTYEEMKDLVIKNFESAKIEADDTFIYMSPETIYEDIAENRYNIYHERLVVASFFLKGFANYEDVVTQAFIKSLGLINFLLVFESVFNNNNAYIFFRDSIKEYKTDKYFREQTDRVLQVFNEMGDQLENIDLTETKEILEQFKEIQQK